VGIWLALFKDVYIKKHKSAAEATLNVNTGKMDTATCTSIVTDAKRPTAAAGEFRCLPVGKWSDLWAVRANTGYAIKTSRTKTSAPTSKAGTGAKRSGAQRARAPGDAS
jgi:hypothetical protein